MKKTVISLSILIVIALITTAVIKYYEFIFAKTVKGTILRVERVSPGDAVIASGGATPNAQLFSFAVSIKDQGGEIHTASTEDRQWAVAQPGQCVEARFFPYPPWNLAKANTFHGARLERLFECKGQ